MSRDFFDAHYFAVQDGDAVTLSAKGYCFQPGYKAAMREMPKPSDTPTFYLSFNPAKEANSTRQMNAFHVRSRFFSNQPVDYVRVFDSKGGYQVPVKHA